MLQTSLFMGGHNNKVYLLIFDCIQDHLNGVYIFDQLFYFQAFLFFHVDDRIDIFPVFNEYFFIVFCKNSHGNR